MLVGTKSILLPHQWDEASLAAPDYSVTPPMVVVVSISRNVLGVVVFCPPLGRWQRIVCLRWGGFIPWFWWGGWGGVRGE